MGRTPEQGHSLHYPGILPTGPDDEDYIASCTCPSWDRADDFDGPDDYAEACRHCPIHN